MALFKRGKSGPEIKVIQEQLNKLIKSRLKIDGKFGPKTEAAVKEFQTKKKLAVDGIVGPKTLKAMKLTLKDLKKGGENAKPKPKPIKISYTVPRLKQPTNMSCWATAIAMMVSWKKHMSIAPETIADELGYTQEFKTGGLHPEDTKVFKYWGLKWQAPMCYSVQGFADLLKSRGPVWIAGNPKAPHVRVIIAMNGDGTPEKTMFTINDPAGGRSYKESFVKAMGRMEDLGEKEAKMKAPIYVAHF